MKFVSAISDWFGTLKIGFKLLGAFLLVLSLTVVLGVFSIFKLAQVNQVSSDLAVKWMPSVGHSTSMRSAMLEVRELEVKHAHAADAGYMEEYEEKMKAAMAVVTQHGSDFEKLIDDPESKTLYGAFSKAWSEYLAVNRKVVALGRANKQDDAKDVGEGAGKSASDDAIVALDKITLRNFEGGRVAAEHAASVYASARIWNFALLAGAVLIGLALSIIITRNLLRQLGGEPGYAAEITRRMAEGDLAVDIALKDEHQPSLLREIKSLRDKFAVIVGQVRQGSEGVATASAEIASGNHDLSSRTESQASALEQTAASMEELSSTVHQNADNARQANQLALSASSVAVKGGEVVGRVVDTMKGINDASKKISDIISVIDGIAFQTNILALNAAVEAARAGEQGRGFAVVASEVRSLAGRSAEAAKEIKTLINASVERVDQGTVLVDQAGSTMQEVVSAIRRVTDIMGEISAASQEQSSGVAQVGEAMSSLDQTTQQNAALVEEMAASASSLKSQADELVQAVSVFKLAAGQGLAQATRISNRPVAPKSQAASAARLAPQPKAAIKVALAAPRATSKATAAPAAGGGDWESF